MSRSDQNQTDNGRVERIQDFAVHEWCRDLLAEPHTTLISKRYISEPNKGVSNTFLTKTLFTDEAVRAYLSIYRPGHARKADHGDKVVSTGDAAPTKADAGQGNASERGLQTESKEEKLWGENDSETPEMLTLVSLGQEVDGGVRRLHGGVTATLLDQVMGMVIAYGYNITPATIDLNIKYKKAINTPCVLLCRAKVVRQKGRWIEAVAWVEDGGGTVFTEGRGSFILAKTAPRDRANL